MKKTTFLPLFFLTALTSTMAAQIIDGKLLTTIMQNASGDGKFIHASNEHDDFDSPLVSNAKKPIATYEKVIDAIINSTYDEMILRSATRHGVDPALIKAIIHTESSFNPRAISPAGAKGLMQLMPSTAKDMGVRDIFDPAQNIEGGVKYLAWLGQQFSNTDHIIAAYNAGHVNVRRHRGIPPFRETRNYVRKVNNRYQTIYVHDTNLNRPNIQLAMNTRTVIMPTNTLINDAPQTPILSQMAGKIHINQQR
ncbi:lytic transglycosylase domain-containing protein [Moraxella oculi]|uniref:Lytic transglycosylase domain-containing protein n=1 Tax=Moraxella oculi TaxID=2940516 RepID=A0ABW8U5S9_9GAMM